MLKVPAKPANKTDFNIMNVDFHIHRKLDIMIFQYGLGPVLIQRKLIGFEAILEKMLSCFYGKIKNINLQAFLMIMIKVMK